MREVLRQTGTAQAASTRQIGPLPNLKDVIWAHGRGVQYIASQQTAYVAPNGGRQYWMWANAGQTYTFSTCGLANFDTVIEVRDWQGGTLYALNDDACGLQSYLSFRPSTSAWYMVRVRAYASYQTGTFTLTVR